MSEYQKEQTEVIECPNPQCPAPHKVKRDGFHGNDPQGQAIQRYECNACGKKFSARGHAMRKQFPADVIADALDSYYSGMSYKQVAEGLEDAYDVGEPSKHSVHDWVKGYTRMALDFMAGKVGPDGTPQTASGKRVRADVGPHWVADELFLRVAGQQMYCWNVMDTKSRYVLAVHLSRHRGTNDAIKVMEKALSNAASPPKKITTDGLGSYVDAIKAVFPKETEHIVSKGIRHEINNNLSERLQGSFRQRTKTQRGLEMLRTGQDYLDGWVLDYNFFKKHESLKGRTPAEYVGVDRLVPWDDSWGDITRMGGEIAEPRIKDVVITALKPGPKPKPKGLEDIEAWYQEQQAIKMAKSKIPNGYKKPVIAGYKPVPKRKTAKTNKPRGQWGKK